MNSDKSKFDNKKKVVIKLPISIIRGGTSKGVYILKDDLPSNKEEWDPLLLRLMGSPDQKQIDGLGGSQSVTSKVAIISKSSNPEADVDYTFAQVSIDKPIVSYKGNCGNISSGVGPFAIEKGLVKAKKGITTVKVFNTNTQKLIIEEVQTPDEKVEYFGEFSIAGVPGTSSPIKLKFINPSGTLGNGLLPTNNPIDILEIPNFGNINASIIDCANPLVFIKAKDVGLTGRENPKEINSNEKILELLEIIRGVAAFKLGIIDDYKKSSWSSPGIPKMTFVAESDDYITSDGKEVKKENFDLLSRMMSMQKAHPNYAMTGAMCTAAAAIIPNSIVNQVISKNCDTQFIRIGHSGGVLECGVAYKENGNNPIIDDTFGFRTANLLMEGIAYIRMS